MNVRQVVPKDAIPSVDDPEFRDTHPEPGDEVVGVEIDGEARAYPIRYLNYHEIVNDRVGGVPIAATWCPLCGSVVVYDRRPTAGELPAEIDDPGTLEFGVSGKLADDDLVMYDRETGSEWKQSLGEAIAGPLAGARLRIRPATTTTWARFRDGHPDAVVMAEPGGESEAAGDGAEPEPVDYDDDPYRDYFEAEGFGLDAHRGDGGGREWDREDLAAKERVLGLEIGGDALAFPSGRVEAAGSVATATVGGEDVVVVADGGEMAAYRDPGFDWRAAEDGLRGDGTLWDAATGEPLDGSGRDPLERLPAQWLFAFAWQDDHGDAFWSP
ncbi:DUF3179 domain-containing protein [Halolamina rubra]|uniref:DUF3179 domain-containing protein n=1 Tax=Halolamina rubra TaxID=1380430 RepID=UPI00067905F5|nr:DUF3179 domain-containing protein [Halolamina rubra]